MGILLANGEQEHDEAGPACVAAPLLAHSQRCAVVRNRNASCRSCVQACPAGALSVDGPRVMLQESLCTGCGMCSAACPTEAIEGLRPSRTELARACAELAQRTHGNVCIACGPALAYARDSLRAQGRKVCGLAEVSCLCAVDETLLVELAARGVRRITLVDNDCTSCILHTGAEQCARAVKAARELLAASGTAGIVLDQTSVLPEENACDQSVTAAQGVRPFMLEPLGRAGHTVPDASFGYAGRAGAPVPPDTSTSCETPGGAADSEQGDVPGTSCGRIRVENGHLPYDLTPRRTRLINSLRRLARSLPEVPDTPLAQAPWGAVRIDRNRCTSCRSCATFCPTGALQKYDEGTGAQRVFGLINQPARCVRCGLCQDVCTTGALSLEGTGSLGDVASGKTALIELDAPAWEANRPDQIFRKMENVLGAQNNIYGF